VRSFELPISSPHLFNALMICNEGPFIAWFPGKLLPACFSFDSLLRSGFSLSPHPRQYVHVSVPLHAGFNVETVEYKNISFTVWDVGGQDKVRKHVLIHSTCPLLAMLW
jgi:hypothetical protein